MKVLLKKKKEKKKGLNRLQGNAGNVLLIFLVFINIIYCFVRNFPIVVIPESFVINGALKCFSLNK